jgi:hypothetical protein
MSTHDLPPVSTTDENGRAKLLLTSPTNSVLENPPTPTSLHSNAEKAEEQKNGITADAPSSNDDEIQYPPMITKVAVGIGLGLAVFLVLPSLFYLG